MTMSVSTGVPPCDLIAGDRIVGTTFRGERIDGRFESFGEFTSREHRMIVVDGAYYEVWDADSFTVWSTESLEAQLAVHAERLRDRAEDIVYRWAEEIPEERFSGTTVGNATLSVTAQEIVELVYEAMRGAR